jgi:hypothetical protein
LAIVTVGAPERTIEVSVGIATVTSVLPLMPFDVAVIVIGVLLTVSAVSRPVGAIVAVAVLDEVQVAVAVRSWVDLSL